MESGGDSLCESTYRLVEWILEQQLPFDSLYYYGRDSRSPFRAASPTETLRVGEASPKDLRPIHISYSPQHRRNIWAFTDKGVPTKRGIEQWLERVELRF